MLLDFELAQFFLDFLKMPLFVSTLDRVLRLDYAVVSKSSHHLIELLGGHFIVNQVHLGFELLFVLVDFRSALALLHLAFHLHLLADGIKNSGR